MVTNLNPSKCKFTTIETSIYAFHSNGYVVNCTTKRKVKNLPDQSIITRRLLDLNTDYSTMNTPPGIPNKYWKLMGADERRKYTLMNLAADHIIPKTKGGSDRLINLQWLPHTLNSSKVNNVI